jgi:hypothetical protein
MHRDVTRGIATGVIGNGYGPYSVRCCLQVPNYTHAHESLSMSKSGRRSMPPIISLLTNILLPPPIRPQSRSIDGSPVLLRRP